MSLDEDRNGPGWVVAETSPGIHLVTDEAELRVVRAWPTGVTVEEPVDEGRRLGPARLETAGDALGGLVGGPARTTAFGVDFSFEDLDEAKAQEVCRFLLCQVDAGRLVAPTPPRTRRTVVTDPVEITAKLVAYRRHRIELRAHGLGASVPFRIVRVHADGVELDLGPEALGFRLDCVMNNQYYQNRFVLMPLRATPAGVFCPFPASVEMVNVRVARRVTAPAGATLRFVHPTFGRVQSAPILDLSHTGLSFRIDTAAAVLYPGMRLDEFCVLGLGEHVLELSGEVRVDARRSDVAAIHLDQAVLSEADRRRWHQRVGDLLTPHTRVGGTWSEESWELFRESGYFRLSNKDEGHFADVKRPFAEVSRRLEGASDVGMQIYRTSARGVEGGISLLRLYSRAIFGYQIARRQDPDAAAPTKHDVLREMSFRAYEQATAFADARWLIGFVQHSAHWSKLLHHDFPLRFSEQGLAEVVSFHAYELETSFALPVRDRSWPVRTALAGDLALLLDVLARTRSPAYLECLDYTPAELGLRTLRKSWERAGMERQRTVLVATRGGDAVAAAVCETAHPGLHLFGLLDSVRLYTLAPGGEAAFGALLDASRGWLKRHGRTRAALLHEGPDFPETASLTDLGGVYLTMMVMDLVPDLLEFVWERTAPRDCEP